MNSRVDRPLQLAVAHRRAPRSSPSARGGRTRRLDSSSAGSGASAGASSRPVPGRAILRRRPPRSGQRALRAQARRPPLLRRTGRRSSTTSGLTGSAAGFAFLRRLGDFLGASSISMRAAFFFFLAGLRLSGLLRLLRGLLLGRLLGGGLRSWRASSWRSSFWTSSSPSSIDPRRQTTPRVSESSSSSRGIRHVGTRPETDRRRLCWVRSGAGMVELPERAAGRNAAAAAGAYVARRTAAEQNDSKGRQREITPIRAYATPFEELLSIERASGHRQ